MDYSKHNNALKIFKIMANANRLKILHLLFAAPGGKLTVTEIVNQFGSATTQGNISSHLVLMRRAGVLKAKQDGLNMYYSIKDAQVRDLVKKML